MASQEGDGADEGIARGMADAAVPFVAASSFETAPVGLLVSDAEGRVLAANAHARRLGAEPGVALADLVPGRERAGLARFLAERRPGRGRSLHMGPRRRTPVRARVWPGAAGRLFWLIEPASPTAEETAARLAHEVQAPITVVRIAAETALMLLDEGEHDLAFLRRQFALVHDQARRALDIAAHMRGFGAGEVGPPVPVDVGACVAATLEARAEALAEAGITVATRLPPAPLYVLGRALPLEQVLRNLIDNARDAITADRARGGRIAVTVTAARGTVRITVADNGGGIPPEHRRRIFEPFFTTKPAERASGLGLAIARDIVAAMGGRIAVGNRDGGTVFTVSLPAAPRHRQPRHRKG